MNKYLEVININDAKNIIEENSLNINDITDYTVGLFIDQILVGTGSLYKNIIKLIAIKKEYQKANLLSLIITNLINELTVRGYHKYFLFTKKDEAKYFLSLNFKEIVTYQNVSYLENSLNPITKKLTSLLNNFNLKDQSIAAVVVNCNPLTNGHLYLIKEALKHHEKLLIFLVSEDKSFFPYEIRKRLLKEATKDLKNVLILPSTEYLISSATFPSYFLKDLSKKSEIEMHLDVLIFKNYFMPIFNISKRYVGTEVTDSFTKKYNNILKYYLKDKLQIIKRLKDNETVISASTVRKLFKENKLKEIKSMVPNATYEFLVSPLAKELLK